MHATLTPKANIRMIVVFAGALAVLVFLSPGPLWFFIVCGAVLGAIGGLLQLQALRHSSPEFIHADTALQVRRVLASSHWGKAYLVVFWLSGLLFLALAIITWKQQFIFGWLAAFLTFGIFRDCTALVAVFELQKRVSAGR
jgi:hypothetical protein